MIPEEPGDVRARTGYIQMQPEIPISHGGLRGAKLEEKDVL